MKKRSKKKNNRSKLKNDLDMAKGQKCYYCGRNAIIVFVVPLCIRCAFQIFDAPLSIPKKGGKR